MPGRRLVVSKPGSTDHHETSSIRDKIKKTQREIQETKERMRQNEINARKHEARLKLRHEQSEMTLQDLLTGDCDEGQQIRELLEACHDRLKHTLRNRKEMTAEVLSQDWLFLQESHISAERIGLKYLEDEWGNDMQQDLAHCKLSQLVFKFTLRQKFFSPELLRAAENRDSNPDPSLLLPNLLPSSIVDELRTEASERQRWLDLYEFFLIVTKDTCSLMQNEDRAHFILQKVREHELRLQAFKDSRSPPKKYPAEFEMVELKDVAPEKSDIDVWDISECWNWMLKVSALLA